MHGQLIEEHRTATALAERLSDAEPGPDRDAALAELDRLLSAHLTREQQVLAPVLGGSFKGASEFKAPTEFTPSADVVPDALTAALAALTDGGPDTDVSAATSTLVQALNEHVHHVEQDLLPLLPHPAASEQSTEAPASDLPPDDIAPDVAPSELAEVEADHERGA